MGLAAALADELLQELHLVLREELRLQVVEAADGDAVAAGALRDRLEVGLVTRRLLHRREAEPVIAVAARVLPLDDSQPPVIAEALANDAHGHQQEDNQQNQQRGGDGQREEPAEQALIELVQARALH